MEVGHHEAVKALQIFSPTQICKSTQKNQSPWIQRLKSQVRTDYESKNILNDNIKSVRI